MTKLEMTIRKVSDLRDFYMKIRKQKRKNPKADGAKRLRAATSPLVAGETIKLASKMK